MATNKKGFILYADQKELFDQLPNDKAGELIKHIFSYVNDENPITEDLLLKLAFTPIKQQLKRDLKKFEEVREKRSEAGKASAEKRKQNATNSTSVKSVEQTSTKLTVKDNDTVNVNDNVKDKEKEINNKPTAFNFRNSFLELGVDSDILNDWLEVRKKKKSVNSKTAFNGFIREVEKTGRSVNEIVKLCAEKSWVSFNSTWDLGKELNNNPKERVRVKCDWN
jgi:hypothetical protein